MIDANAQRLYIRIPNPMAETALFHQFQQFRPLKDAGLLTKRGSDTGSGSVNIKQAFKFFQLTQATKAFNSCQPSFRTNQGLILPSTATKVAVPRINLAASRLNRQD